MTSTSRMQIMTSGLLHNLTHTTRRYGRSSHGDHNQKTHQNQETNQERPARPARVRRVMNAPLSEQSDDGIRDVAPENLRTLLAAIPCLNSANPNDTRFTENAVQIPSSYPPPS
jgi:hypothetical protein